MPQPASSPPRPPETAPAAGPARSGFWQRRIVAPVLAQLQQGASPDGLARTAAAGVICGVFPFLGFTTGLCFLAALVFRLNQPLIHILNQLLWPVQLALIPVYVAAGARLFGAEPPPLDVAEIARVFRETPGEFWARFGWMGAHAFTAWLLSVPFLWFGTYLPLRFAFRRLAAAAA